MCSRNVFFFIEYDIKVIYNLHTESQSEFIQFRVTQMNSDVLATIAEDSFQVVLRNF